MQYDIETFSLTKIFSDWWGREKVCAVDNLDLKVRHNEVFGLLGPNGSGKTTTLKMLLGLLYPTKGKAVVLGGDSTDPKINCHIGFLPEESYLYRYLTARETLDFYGRLFGLPSKVRKMRIEALLEMVGLKAVANRSVGTYSKGMARRIGLAQALINDPDLLILDEPTTGLDPIGTRQIKDLMLELAERGKTILLCSHLLADVEDVCDRIAILYGGRIQSEGQVRELLQRTDKKQIVTGSISDAAIEKIKQLVHNENADCEITSPMEKLETFFIKIVAEAREQAQPTSGAVSTTEIGNFLIGKTAKENLLEKLVSAPVSAETQLKPPTTEKISPVETVQDASTPDERLLSELTSRSAPVETTPVIEDNKTKPAAAKAEVPQEQIRKDILDQLAGRDKSEAEDSRKTDNNSGESGDG